MKNATSKASTTARARRRCAKLGDKCERTKCCSSGAAAVVLFAIGVPSEGLEGTELILFHVGNSPHETARLAAKLLSQVKSRTNLLADRGAMNDVHLGRRAPAVSRRI